MGRAAGWAVPAGEPDQRGGAASRATEVQYTAAERQEANGGSDRCQGAKRFAQQVSSALETRGCCHVTPDDQPYLGRTREWPQGVKNRIQSPRRKGWKESHRGYVAGKLKQSFCHPGRCDLCRRKREACPSPALPTPRPPQARGRRHRCL